MTSITEVARLAGVSTATASRVVSSADYPVSPATRARVLDAARTLDYVPNALARGLLKSQIPVVAVVVHDITDPYFAEVVRGVEDAASPAGYLVITCSSERDAERETSYVRLLRSMRAAGVIFAASGLDDPASNQEIEKHLAAMRGDGAAVVHLSPHALGPADVGVDNEAGMASMVSALVALGHREIAFLAGPSTLFVARARLAGYRRGLERGGDPVRRAARDPHELRQGRRRPRRRHPARRIRAVHRDRLRQRPAGDGRAGASCRARIDVPAQVSVAGFDDVPVAAITSPSLSTVRLPLREMGRRGFTEAARILGGDQLAPAVLPTELAMRASTAAPPAVALP